MHVILVICVIWFFCICSCVGKKILEKGQKRRRIPCTYVCWKKSFLIIIFGVLWWWKQAHRHRGTDCCSQLLISPVSLLQSLTTSRPSSGVRLCCCLHQQLWELWVIGVLSADWRRSVSALTVRPPAPVLFDSLCLPHHSFVWWLSFPLEPGE